MTFFTRHICVLSAIMISLTSVGCEEDYTNLTVKPPVYPEVDKGDKDDKDNKDDDDKDKDDDNYVHGELAVVDDPLFPFDIDEDIILTVDIDLNAQSPMNDRQLGVNSTLKDSFVAAKGYNAPNSKAFIEAFQPTVMRFPNGVYGNFYKWDEDCRYLPYVATDLASSTQPKWNNSSHEGAGKQNFIKLGVQGLIDLKDQLGFEILWIWCMNHVDATMVKTTGKFGEKDCRWYDAEGKSYSKYEAAKYDTKARYKYYTEELNTPVDCVELGNEPFFASQRSAFTAKSYYNPTPSLTSELNRDMGLIAAIADELRELNPKIKLAAPFSWRRGSGNSVSEDSRNHYAYNKQYLEISDAFDAMVLHKYVKPTGFSKSTMSKILTVRQDYESDFKYYRQFEPTKNKEIWMTEWSIGVTSTASSEGDTDGGGSGDASNAASALALADLYLYMFDLDYLTHIDYFQVHGASNPFYINSGTLNAMVLTKTGFGATFEILKGMFTGCKKLKTTLQGAPLFKDGYNQKWHNNGSKHTLSPVYGVSAKAVIQADGTHALLLVNKTNRECKLNIKFNGEAYEDEYDYEYLNYDSLDEEKTWAQSDYVFTWEQYRKGDIIIKPYSITKISDFEVGSNE